MKIKIVDGFLNKTFNTRKVKTQVCIHHTVSGNGVEGDINTFINNRSVFTPVIISRSGQIYQLYSTANRWSHHIGVTSSFRATMVGANPVIPYTKYLDEYCIGVELDSWGGLIMNGRGSWENIYGGKVSSDLVVHYPKGYRGYYGYERYTDEQISSLRELLNLWIDRYGIDKSYVEINESVSKLALSGKSGIYCHSHYRIDKSDCHPQDELVLMLKNL